ncbi:MAG: type I polyketide synthase [Okeania sp. SIO3B5]|uniref:type I polyketide synthase n=1 Tax=Okeania sp. SIO3B5 TaxID=2607811 RepID=UPI001400364F|nr:type I polyketide synthase [Okeania sp. SIO3B5]NEO58574.1 type I polyketide synthase [Okeania sp. SIO3B5]
MEFSTEALNKEYSTTKKALIAIKKLQDKLEELEQAKSEPIAIIGMGCRLPGGVNNPSDLWSFLHNKKDGITPFPADHFYLNTIDDDFRLKQSPQKLSQKSFFGGGFIPHLKTFDAHFFNIAPREAVSLDPQQRVLLEVSWEALENAGIPPDDLKGSSTGVFIGICGNDYWHQILRRKPPKIDAYCTTGNTHSNASGRLSYFLGLTGPSLSVNTACSSSLVAIHLAITSLRNQECDLAIVGGVNRIICPEITESFSKAQMLSPDSRCKTFDASANGFVRSEGCGVIVLKRLQTAIADHNHILAVLRGSAVNQDGRTSGLTAPNSLSQQAVIQKALKNACIQAEDVSYVEAHGTGTLLGDSVEIGALAGIFSNRRTHPLIIGSVKPNIGHSEAAAGVVSLMKVVLCLQKEAIPPQIHFNHPNPHINWSELPFKIPTEEMPWVNDKNPRIAGVSSFGFSGTNAHVIVSDLPNKNFFQLKKNSVIYPTYLFTLSAKTSVAQKDLIQQYCTFIKNHSDLDLADICFTANTGRSDFNYRLAVVTPSLMELQQKLTECITQKSPKDLWVKQVRRNHTLKLAFFFGQRMTPDWRQASFLYQTQTIFQQIVDECKEIILSDLKIDLGDFFARQNQKDYELKLILFTLEYALCNLLKSWGMMPTIVISHGIGKWVAATVAGVISLTDSLRGVIGEKKANTITSFPAKIPLFSYANEQLLPFELSTLQEPISVEYSDEQALKILVQKDYDMVILIQFTSPQLWHSICSYVGQFYCLGGSINWQNFAADNFRFPILLPNYPFQRTMYWYE